ncbi:MAG: hypothetical protein ACE5FA_06925 [Dehalococcoidia bacterium]
MSGFSVVEGDVALVDQGSGEAAEVQGGRLLVSDVPATPPTGATAVSQQAVGDVSGSTDTIYVIPNAQTLTVSTLLAGAESVEGKKASKVALYEDPNGDLSVLNYIGVPAYVANSNFAQALNESFVGDGTRRIVLRRERLDGGTLEIAGYWSGWLA